jgi:hypothetical protein
MTAIMPIKNVSDISNGINNDTNDTSNVNDIREVEATLRGELSARAVGLPAGGSPVPRIATAVRRDRMRRRTYAGTGFVLVAALVAAATPAILGAAHGAGVASASARGAGPSQLLSMSPRGNLVADTAFLQAVETRLSGDKVLYANDDGTHTVVIAAGTTEPSSADFRTLVGGHDASVPQLQPATGGGAFSQETKTYTFVGESTAGDAHVSLVVLGPMDLTDIEYATGIRLAQTQSSLLMPVRTGVRRLKAADGVAETELADTEAPNSSSGSGLYFAVRVKLGKQYVVTSPTVRVLPTSRAGNIEDPDYDPIRAAIVAKGASAGITLALKGSTGDALADNVALVLSDVANLADVTPSDVTTRVDWAGRETPEWDSALVEFAAPGLPAFQAFIRGLAPGVADGDSPSLAQSFVRPVGPLTRGHLPTTAVAFGGTPEFTTIGGGLFERW